MLEASSASAEAAYLGEVPEGTHMEGARRRVGVNRCERDPALRAACLAHWGATCRVCAVDMGETYGPMGAGFVHVHHRTPLASGTERATDPVRDLVPVCPNGHAMLHTASPPVGVEELAARVRAQQANSASAA